MQIDPIGKGQQPPPCAHSVLRGIKRERWCSKRCIRCLILHPSVTQDLVMCALDLWENVLDLLTNAWKTSTRFSQFRCVCSRNAYDFGGARRALSTPIPVCATRGSCLMGQSRDEGKPFWTFLACKPTDRHISGLHNFITCPPKISTSLR